MKQLLRRMLPMVMILAMFVGFFPATQTAYAADENPMRAIWLRPKETTKEQVEAHVQQIKDAGLNTIFLETVFCHLLVLLCPILPLLSCLLYIKIGMHQCFFF